MLPEGDDVLADRDTLDVIFGDVGWERDVEVPESVLGVDGGTPCEDRGLYFEMEFGTTFDWILGVLDADEEDSLLDVLGAFRCVVIGVVDRVHEETDSGEIDI